MAAKSVNALSSFTDLLDGLPQWTNQVTELKAYASVKHDDFRSEYTRLVHKAKPKRIRTDSMCSIHTKDDDNDLTPRQTDASSSTLHTVPDLTQISPLEAGNRYIYAQAYKKRKPGTSIRSAASGPMKFHSKQMVVIYFDSHVQDQFVSLVKSLGNCRNDLRKGKMAYTLSRGLQLPGLRPGTDRRSPMGVGRTGSPLKSRSSPRLTTTKDDNTPVEAMKAGESAFMNVDKDLETCQNLCETAAHQFLRDGDCKAELDIIISTLTRVHELAKSTYAVLKAEDEQRHAEQRLVEQTDSSSGSMHTVSDSTLVDQASHENLQFSGGMGKYGSSITLEPYGLHKAPPPLSSTTSAPLLTTEIEVDDDSDASSIEIDMSTFRMNRARPAVRTRV